MKRSKFKTSIREQSSGFSLLEVLVAFAILAMSLGVLMQIFAGGMRSAKLTGVYSKAVDLAESVLARVGVELSPLQGVRSGTEGELQWAVDAVPYQLEGFVAPPQSVELYLVTARVFWTDGAASREVTLHTIKNIPKL